MPAPLRFSGIDEPLLTPSEALEAVNDGKLTENWGGALFGNGHIERAENAAGRRNILMQQQHWLESMFGSLPKSWS